MRHVGQAINLITLSLKVDDPALCVLILYQHIVDIDKDLADLFFHGGIVTYERSQDLIFRPGATIHLIPLF